MVLSRKYSVRIADFYFEDGKLTVPVDIRRFTQLSFPRGGGQCKSFHTIIIDLSQDPKALLSKLKRDTRYDVRRAIEREGLQYDCWQECNEDIINSFADFYDGCARQIDRPKVSRTRFKNLARYGFLDISRVSSQSGEPLIWHSHYRGKSRARLLESASLYRNAPDSAYRTFMGRANRYHHWRDMMRFKDLGCTVYDFGGWYAGNEDAHKLRINAFKEEFGGTIVENFNCTEPLTWKGKIAAALLYYLRN
jgi:hypothetical protein